MNFLMNPAGWVEFLLFFSKKKYALRRCRLFACSCSPLVTWLTWLLVRRQLSNWVQRFRNNRISSGSERVTNRKLSSHACSSPGFLLSAVRHALSPAEEHPELKNTKVHGQSGKEKQLTAEEYNDFFGFLKFAFHGRKMVTYDQYLNFYWGRTKQRIHKSINQKRF